jgi:hypothetical protein
MLHHGGDNVVKNRLVLVIEADPVMQRHLGSLLFKWGYEPVPVESDHSH